MSKWCSSNVADAALNKIATSIRMMVCSGQPANFSGIAAVALADVTVASGDFTVAASGTGNGRKVTVAAKNTVQIDTAGTATHVSLDDGSTLLYVTTCASQALSQGGTVDIPSWTVTYPDPT